MEVKISKDIKRTSLKDILESVDFEVHQHIAEHGKKPLKIFCYWIWEDYTTKLTANNIILRFEQEVKTMKQFNNRFDEIEPFTYRFFEVLLILLVITGYALAWFACNILK